MISKNHTKRILTKPIFITLSWGNFQIFGLYFFIIFQSIYCFFALCTSKWRISNKLPRIIKVLLFLHIVTCFSGIMTDLPNSFKGYSLIMSVAMLPSYLSFLFLRDDFKKGTLSFEEISKWIKIGFLIQIIYLPIQYVAYKFGGIDLNKLIFTDVFHFMKDATFYRQGTWYPSGFTWHSAYLAPILVIAVLIFENNYIRMLVLLDAFLCGNNTALVGVSLAIVFLIGKGLFVLDKRIKKRSFVELTTVLLALGICVLAAGGANAIYDKAMYLMYRIIIQNGDTSSVAHASYYFLYSYVVKNQPVLTSLFGTGYGSSGYAITKINSQYLGLRHWVVESDIIDILISRGIIGFLAYYEFLLKIMRNGKKIDVKYFVVITIIVLQGITYNVQFEYLFFIELIMLESIIKRKNIFDNTIDKKA